jgi:glutamate N-acetyltransferase/amino-acid N-acetyltransferase
MTDQSFSVESFEKAIQLSAAMPKPEYLHDANVFGIGAAKGFLSAGVHAGVKRKKKDVALIYSALPAVAAGVFTTNVLRAAPVLVCEQHLQSSTSTRAIVCNSGNANACTGEQGLKDAFTMAEATAKSLGLAASEVLVSSTGVIGQPLPIDNVVTGINQAALLIADSNESHHDAAEAIMTTDTFAKEYAVKVELTSGKTIHIGGVAKGSGMICPNMATMLSFVATDAKIDKALLQAALQTANEYSFNRITVDGDTSTNDMVAVLANGAAGAETILSNTENFERFKTALQYVLTVLAKLIVKDGEGATKLVEITVAGAKSEADAVQAARTVANSNLVKTAIHGEDANWGRIVAALGRAGIAFLPENVEIFFNSLPILRKNYQVVFNEDEAKAVLSQKEIQICIHLNDGDARATVWTCDLSEGYVQINGSYRT